MINSEKQIKKQTGVRLDSSLIKELKYLSIDRECSLTELFEEAVKDLLEKHREGK